MTSVSQPEDAAPPPDGVVATYGDQLREKAATCRLMADKQREHAATFRNLAERGMPGSADMADKTERAVQHMEQLGYVLAQQALAYDEMMAAGGPDNSRAYVEYEAMTRRLNALIPQDTLTD